MMVFYHASDTRVSHRSKTRRNISPFRCIRAAMISFIKLPDGRQYIRVRPSVCFAHSWSGTCLTAPVPAISHTSVRLPTCLPSLSACLSAYLLVFPPAYLRVQSGVLVMPSEPSFHRQIFLWHSQSISISFH